MVRSWNRLVNPSLSRFNNCLAFLKADGVGQLTAGIRLHPVASDLAKLPSGQPACQLWLAVVSRRQPWSAGWVS